MQVAIIGTGYVGLPTGVGLAELGHNVACIDQDKTKIEKLQAGEVTLYEDGLAELLSKNHKSGHIRFTSSMQDGLANADIVLIAVGTPPHPVTHEADLKYLYAAATELAPYISRYTVIATKSTVPIGTGDNIEALIRKNNPRANFDVISLPEFLREGFAVHDFFHPDRIVVGTNSTQARELIEKLYAPLLERNPQTKMLFVNRRSSETIKYASNSFLAIKLHFINEMADFCEKTGANIYEVAEGMGLDKRIGPKFLNPGPGFGGSCFPKDTLAITFMANQYDVNLSLIQATIDGNRNRINNMAKRILDILPNDESEPIIGVLGLAFKNGTDDCRFSPAMRIIEHVLNQNPHVKLQVFDPKAMENAKELLSSQKARVTFCENMEQTCENADVIAVLTEWKEFKQLDLAKAATTLRHLNIVDCRNIINQKAALDFGFNYLGIGLPNN